MFAFRFVAVAVIALELLAVPAGDVTCSVVDPLVPGESESAIDKNVAVQPAGTLRVKSNVAVAQAVVSLFVIVTLNGTMVPALTPALCDGVMVRVGLARVQTGTATAAWTAAAAFTRP